MTTLIVRDATLAVNGAPETRGNARDHLARRIDEVRRMPEPTAEECAEVLQAACGDLERADPEVLLGLTILGLARPEVLERVNASGVAIGRRVAARFEQNGDADAALALVEQLRLEHPEHAALERDYDAILRRLGMVQDLADRYYDRATHLLKQGKEEEATAWLKEVLLLDRSRKDVARLIRDLRLEDDRRNSPRKLLGARAIVMAMLVPALLTAVVLREKSLEERYSALPAATVGNIGEIETRLVALEHFQEKNPVWYGFLRVLNEQSNLRIELARLREDEANRREHEVAALSEKYEQATLLYERARIHVDLQDYATALTDFRQSLEFAPAGWPLRERVERDIAALEELLTSLQETDPR